MMGRHHAAMGAAAWLSASIVAPGAVGVLDVGPAGIFTGAIVCAGAALLPDADHPNATIAHSVPGAGQVVAGAVGSAAGGHRHATHGLLAVLVAGVATFFLGMLTWQPEWWHSPIALGPAIATMALIAFAVKVLRFTRTWASAWLYGFLAAAVIAFFAPAEHGWLVICVTLGYAVHLVGDFLTVGGLPLFWPWHPKPPKVIANIPVLSNVWMSNGYFALPLVGKTGSGLEVGVFAVVCLYSVYLVSFQVLSYFDVDLVDVMAETFAGAG